MNTIANDPFISILRSRHTYSPNYIRATSPPNVVRVSIERERERAATGAGTSRRSKESPRDILLRSMQMKPIIGTKPPTICINCSKPASICTPCNEIMCRNALIFQRSHSCIGAIEFFKKAVRETGHSKLVKRIVFQLWRNGYKQRAHTNNKLQRAIDIFLLKNTVTTPFRAWRLFVKDIVELRKSKRIEELTTKVHQLEETLRKHNAAVDASKVKEGG
jgi:hypothetical protein